MIELTPFIGALCSLIVSEVLPFVKKYISKDDINSICQLLFFAGKTLGKNGYYICSGQYHENKKRQKLIAEAEALGRVLEEKIKAEIHKNLNAIDISQIQQDSSDEDEVVVNKHVSDSNLAKLENVVKEEVANLSNKIRKRNNAL